MLVYFGTTIIILAAIYMLIALLLGAKAGIWLWIVMVIVSIGFVAQMVGWQNRPSQWQKRMEKPRRKKS